jgi:pimeloyl-ACP methyl ester carboxylesterase
MPEQVTDQGRGDHEGHEGQGSRPRDARTYVLLHGAWHGGWCWQKVTPALRAAGHVVYTPTQTGLGERSHLLSQEVGLETFAQDLINLLVWEDLRDVVLVGHSFGGNAITAAADRVPERIGHLVYLDAIVPVSGQSAFACMDPDLVASRRESATLTSGVLTLPVPEPTLFGATDAEDIEWLRAKCTPHPMPTYEQALVLNHPPSNGLPATYIAVTPHWAPTTASRNYAKERHAQGQWSYMEMAAGHDAMVTSPDVLARLLLELA